MTSTAAVKRHADDARSSTRKRNAAILRAHANGASLREIGKAAGITHAAVRFIVMRDAR